MNFIAKRISEARRMKGLTQEDLAEQSKVNLRTIQRIENSESEPRSRTLQLICEVLEIDVKELLSTGTLVSENTIGAKIANGIFLIAINLVLMGILGFVTLDSNANSNSLFAGILLSFFIPFFIVTMTRKLDGLMRITRYGFGYIAYFILVIMLHGFPLGFVSGLFPCILISLSVLYFGSKLLQID